MFIPDGITSASHPPRMRGLKHTIREGIISLCLRGRQRSSLSRILPIKQIFCRAGIYRRANFDCKLCKYNDGKIYNCDLSAAQNIGARFFLREYQKKGVTGFPSTPLRTLSTLREFVNNGLPVAA